VTDRPDNGSGTGRGGRRGTLKVGVVVALTLLAVFAMRMASGGVALRRAGRDESRLATSVAAEQTEVGLIQEAVVTAESDAYVEEWARESRELAQPGDRVVVPVPEEATTQDSSPGESPEGDWWTRFRRWIRGE